MRRLIPAIVKCLVAPLVRVRKALVAAPAQEAESERILVVRLDAIGDVLLTVPMLRAIRMAIPRAIITVVVTSQTHNILETCPHVDEVLVFDASKSGFLGRIRRLLRAVTVGLRDLVPRRFDVAIVPRWDVDDFDAAVLAFSSGAVRRIGFSEFVNPHKANANRNMDLLFTEVVVDRSVSHEAERPLKLLATLGIAAHASALEVTPDDSDRSIAKDALKPFSKDLPLVAIAMGAAHPRRRWPKDRFIAVARALADDARCGIVVLGGPGDESAGTDVCRVVGGNARSFAGALTLRQTAAVLESCDLLVTNDSGPLHLGAAVGVPVVEISCHPLGGDPALEHSPARFGPWRVAHAILQPSSAMAPCTGTCESPEAHCITRVSVGDVVQACGGLLEGAAVSGWRTGPAGRTRGNQVKSASKSDDDGDTRLDRGAGRGVG